MLRPFVVLPFCKAIEDTNNQQMKGEEFPSIEVHMLLTFGLC